MQSAPRAIQKSQVIHNVSKSTDQLKRSNRPVASAVQRVYEDQNVNRINIDPKLGIVTHIPND